jgi:SAM-dependent methyltransferase
MDNNLTDRAFWKAFWESRKGLIFYIKPNYIFGDLLARLIKKNDIKSAIELGGFPGYYTIYLKKYQNLDTTLLDYFVHEGLVNELLETNGLKPSDISVIETDLFTYQPVKKYDMVLSFGLIEHFADTKEIIKTHLGLLNPSGTLFITLPNFTGINGWIQRTFDRDNYDKHNIASMDLALLRRIYTELGLTEIDVHYHGRFSVWLENRETTSAWAKFVMKAVWIAGKGITKIIPFESKLLSPYIVTCAKVK